MGNTTTFSVEIDELGNLKQSKLGLGLGQPSTEIAQLFGLFQDVFAREQEFRLGYNNVENG